MVGIFRLKIYTFRGYEPFDWYYTTFMEQTFYISRCKKYIGDLFEGVLLTTKICMK